MEYLLYFSKPDNTYKIGSKNDIKMEDGPTPAVLYAFEEHELKIAHKTLAHLKITGLYL